MTSTISNFPIKNNQKRADLVVIIFWVLIVFNLIGIASGYLEIALLEDVKNGYYVTEEEANANDTRQQIIGILQLGLFITSAVVFLNWFRRAYGNLHRIGDKTLRHSESLAVWSFIIPIVCYFWPYQIMSDIWDQTQYHIKKFKSEFIPRTDKYLLYIWWALFIFSNLVGRILLRSVFKDETIDELIASSELTLFTDALQIIEAAMVILIVKRISGLETQLETVYTKAQLVTTEEEE